MPENSGDPDRVSKISRESNISSENSGEQKNSTEFCRSVSRELDKMDEMYNKHIFEGLKFINFFKSFQNLAIIY